jgi:hypothetical protein
VSVADLYRKLCRLRVKRARLDRRIGNLERKLAGAKARWGGCSWHKNR